MVLAASEEAWQEKKGHICGTWSSEAFSDVSLMCGIDGGIVRTSRLFLAGLSQYLYKLFRDHDGATEEDVVVILPDVDSRIFSNFLDNVCLGEDKPAKVDSSLRFLSLEHSLDLGDTGGSIKPEYYQYQDGNRFVDDGTVAFGDDLPYPDQDNEDQDDPRPIKAKTKMSKPRHASLAWQFFDRVDDAAVACKICGSMIRCQCY